MNLELFYKLIHEDDLSEYNLENINNKDRQDLALSMILQEYPNWCIKNLENSFETDSLSHYNTLNYISTKHCRILTIELY